MLVHVLMRLVVWFLEFLLSRITMVPLPDNLVSFFLVAVGHLINGFRIVGAYFDLPYLFVLFGMCLGFEGGMWIYKLIIWILRKIPFLNIK